LRSGPTFSLRDLLQDGLVQDQLGHRFFEPAVFLFQFFEPLDGLLLGSAILLLPTVKGRRADFDLFAYLFDALSRRQQRRCFTQLLDDLFGCVSFALHGESKDGAHAPPLLS